MKLKTSYLSGIKKLILMVVAVAGIFLCSCKKDMFSIPTNTATIRFSASSYTIERNAPEPLTVVLPLSLPLEEAGTAVVTIDAQSTAIAGTEYSVDPLIPAEGITINLEKGATEVSFKVASMDNFEGDRTVVFKLTSADGGVTVSNTNATTIVNIKGKPIILPAIVSSVSILDNFGNVNSGTASPSKSYTISGVKLTSNLSIVASSNFQVSLDNITFSSSLNIGFANVNNTQVNIYVRFLPNTGTNQGITGTITHSSGTVPGVTIDVSGNEVGNALPGVLIMGENFDYGTTAGTLTAVNGGNWAVFSGTVNPVVYVVPGLTYPGYIGSGIGGAVISTNGSGSREDMFRNFTAQSSGVLYTSQLLNFSSAPAAGDFFTSWRDPAAAYFNRLYAKDVSGKLALGIAKSSTTTAYSATNYDYGTTYLVVTKYDFTSGVSSLYVLSGTIPSIEPANPDGTTNVGTGPASVTNIIIRQNTGVLTTTLDGIRVATSWKAAVGL